MDMGIWDIRLADMLYGVFVLVHSTTCSCEWQQELACLESAAASFGGAREPQQTQRVRLTRVRELALEPLEMLH